MRLNCLANALVLLVAFAPGAFGQAAEVDFEQHIKPIFREHCWACHKQGAAKSGLALDSFAAIMEGGASGDVVAAGDLDGSRIWQLVLHQDQPVMPPSGARMPEQQLNLIKAWIEGGLLETAGGTRQKMATGLEAMELVQLPDGQIGPMPANLFIQPVVVTSRTGAIASVAASPNAPLVAIAGQRQILLYHANERRLMGVLPFVDGTPHAVRFSHGGRWIIVAGGRPAFSGRVSIYDVVTGEWLTDLGEDSDSWLAADISANRQFVAAGGPTKLVHVIDTSTGETVTKLNRHTDWIQAVSYSAKGNLLASGDRNGGIWLWELPGHRELLACSGHKAAITALDWRPDGKSLASASEDGTIRMWSPQSGKEAKKWDAHPGGALSVRWTRDGRLVSVGRDQHTKLWDAAGKLIKDFDAHADIALSCAATYDNSWLISADWLGNCKLWSVENDESHSLETNPPSLQSTLAQVRAEVQQASDQLGAANREMELLATTRQHLRKKYNDMLNEALGTGGDEAQPSEPDEAVLKQIGEVVVERERLDKREPEARQAVAAATDRLKHAQARQQETEREIERLDQRLLGLQTELKEVETRCSDLQSRLGHHHEYAAKLRTIIANAADAVRLSQENIASEVGTGVLDKTMTEVQRLAEELSTQIDKLTAELDAARLQQQLATKRLALFKSRMPIK